MQTIRKVLFTLFDLALIVLLFCLLHERLLDYFDPEGSFILTAGEHLFDYGILATPEYQFFGDTAPSSPYYVAYFLAGLSVKLFGHTSLGAVAWTKFFTLMTMFTVYGIGRLALGSRLWGWIAAAFLLVFPFSREFVTTRGDWAAVFFGWFGVFLLLWAAKSRKEKRPGRGRSFYTLVPAAAGVSTALSFFTHPLGFQFYVGACLLMFLVMYGPFMWAARREFWSYLAGFSLIAGVFALFVINWQKYLYFAGHFKSYTTQFLPLDRALPNLLSNLDRAAGPFFFMLRNQEHLAADPRYMPWVLAAIAGGLLLGLIVETIGRPRMRPVLFLFLVLLLNLFLYVYAVPAYRQYIVHALPLLGLMTGVGAWSLARIAALRAPEGGKAVSTGLACVLVLALAWPCAVNLNGGRTLFTAPGRYTLVQDAVADMRSVIPPGSRVVCDVNGISLFPDNIVRSLYVFMQFAQPPVPEYIRQQQAEDGIVDPVGQDYRTRQRNNLNARYHFLRFVPEFIVTDYYADMNCAEPVVSFDYRIRLAPPARQEPFVRTLTVYRTNYNEWPFREVPVGARLYPSFSDPLSARRFREFLTAGIPRPVVKPEPVLIADAGPDMDVKMPLDSDEIQVKLDGRGSTSMDSKIASYEWQVEYEPLAEGETASLSLGYGEHVVHLVVTDARGLRSRDTALVEVFWDTSGLVNCALKDNGGRATASLSHCDLDPGNAVDGVIEGDMSDSWTSEPTSRSWWQVDLGEPRDLAFVVIYFRSDFHQAVQAAGFEILASNDPKFETYEVVAERAAGEPFPERSLWKTEIDADGEYRYVRLSKNTDAHTSLHEIEVYCREPGTVSEPQPGPESASSYKPRKGTLAR